ncbi:MAG: hypothetical protein AB7O52_15225 [Planctomycetota bacterium]
MVGERHAPKEVSGAGRTETAGETVDQGKGRMFPCEGCGADLEFHIGQQGLKCPYCGYVKQIELAEDAKIQERDLATTFDRLVELRKARRVESAGPKAASGVAEKEIRCEACGGTVIFTGTLVSTSCSYCGSPIQIDAAHQAQERIPVDAVLPFQVPRDRAQANLRAWVKSRWFAPNEFKRRGVDGRFSGVYLPYWTYDSLTFTHYVGQRGEYYYVTVGSGKNQRRERRTRWYPASGAFQRFFDDVLVDASHGLPTHLVRALEPWPLSQCLPYTQQVLAGYLARTYDVEVDAGFETAKQRIAQAILVEVKQRIGGDTQNVLSVDTRHDAVTFKHLLLPLWLLVYRYHDKSYNVVVNAATGEVQGQRPWSWMKIVLAILAGGALAVVALWVIAFFDSL